MRRERAQLGFSLLEMLIVVAIVLIVTGISIMNVRPAIRNARVETAYHTTVMQTRRARQAAVDNRRIHIITFVAPRTIQIQRREEPGGALTMISQLDLPGDIQFTAEPGIPTNPLQTPDQFGVGAVAIDFNNGNQIFFQADGSALDGLGRINNGVIYLARPGELGTARAVTLFGATGRVKGWRLTQRPDLAWEWR